MLRASVLTVVLCLSSIAVSSIANEPADQDQQKKSTWITLGTMGGPVPDPDHSQPANALLLDDNIFLVDVGDGTAGRLAMAGLSMHAVRSVFISHLHFDHTGGLPALISLRWQTSSPDMLTIYGPPGTRQTVEGIFAFMTYGAAGHYGVPGRTPLPASHNVAVVELVDGERVDGEGFTVTVVRNAHYSWPKGSDEWHKFQSFSYRFDMPDRSIVYSGDTGPSKALTELAQGADLLVSEMMDIEATIAKVKRFNPSLRGDELSGMEAHLSHHHLTPEQVGKMATAAKVKEVVVTHMAPGLSDPERVRYYTDRVKTQFDGEVTIAADLDRF